MGCNCEEFGHNSGHFSEKEKTQGDGVTGNDWCYRKQGHMACYCTEIKQDMIVKKMGNFEKVKVAVNQKSDDSNNCSLVGYYKFGRAITHSGEPPNRQMREHCNASKFKLEC